MHGFKKWVAAALMIMPFFVLSGCEHRSEVIFRSEIETEVFSDIASVSQHSEEYSEQYTEQKNEVTKSGYVFICGAVQAPGVYPISKDMRIFELVELAGGFSAEADREWINLSLKVQDGDQIRILTTEETQEIAAGKSADTQTSDTDYRQETADGKVNINTADKETLMTLPGIGKARADQIIQYRTEHGGFGAIEEIQHISGIKSAVFQKIKDMITV